LSTINKKTNDFILDTEAKFFAVKSILQTKWKWVRSSLGFYKSFEGKKWRTATTKTIRLES
jgi:predicted nucleotidyltransferase